MDFSWRKPNADSWAETDALLDSLSQDEIGSSPAPSSLGVSVEFSGALDAIAGLEASWTPNNTTSRQTLKPEEDFDSVQATLEAYTLEDTSGGAIVHAKAASGFPSPAFRAAALSPGKLSSSSEQGLGSPSKYSVPSVVAVAAHRTEHSAHATDLKMDDLLSQFGVIAVPVVDTEHPHDLHEHNPAEKRQFLTTDITSQKVTAAMAGQNLPLKRATSEQALYDSAKRFDSPPQSSTASRSLLNPPAVIHVEHVPGLAVDTLPKMLAECTGFTNDEGAETIVTSPFTFPEEMALSVSPFDTLFYEPSFAGQAHINILGIDTSGEPWIISVKRVVERVKTMFPKYSSAVAALKGTGGETGSSLARENLSQDTRTDSGYGDSKDACIVCVRSKNGEGRTTTDVKKSLCTSKKARELLSSLPYELFYPDDLDDGKRPMTPPEFRNLKWISSTKREDEICQRLLNYEEKLLVRSYKFGALFCDAGQTDENDMFGNHGGHPGWEEFLEFLGDKITLKGWTKYRNGLDVQNGSTGEYSVYTAFCDFEIMFHVSTLLPYQTQDIQRLERKRHFGNDMVVIIFKDGDQLYAPDTVKSMFNQVIFVIEKVPSVDSSTTFFRLAISRKDGVPDFGPPLPSPPVFQKNHYFREYLFAKLINAERAALQSPDFRFKMERTRSLLLQSICDHFLKKPAND